MGRTRVVHYEGIDYFAGWQDQQFWKWFAGFFDGEGCIHLPKSGFDVSVSSTNRDIIESIHRFVQRGYVEEITFDQPGWNTKYSWRVRRWSDARSVLIGLRPYLTIKADKADLAFNRMGDIVDRINAVRSKHANALRLASTGLTQAEIGDKVGLCRSAVSLLLKRAADRGLTPEDIEDEREAPVFERTMRSNRQHHLKPPVKVKTTRQRLTPKR